MTKALEAGIYYKMTWTEPVHGNKDIVQKMERIVCIEPLDDEPEKPEPQGSVDWEAIAGISQVYCTESRKHEIVDAQLLEDIIQWLKKNQSQWLHKKPTWETDGAGVLIPCQVTLEFFRKYLDMPDGNLEDMCREVIKLKDQSKPTIDPEIKRVYEKYKDYIEGRKGYDGTASKGIVEISNGGGE